MTLSQDTDCLIPKLPTTKGYIMLEVSKTKLKIIAYRLRDAEKILDSYGNTNSLIQYGKLKKSDYRLKEAQIIMAQTSQDLLNMLEGNDLKDVEKEIERLQRSLTN